MGQLGPLLADATKHLAAADDLEGATEYAPVSEAALQALRHLMEAKEIVDSVARTLSLYVMEHHGVSRRDVAQATGLSASTIQRWVTEEKRA